jgi:hypothetical protein
MLFCSVWKALAISMQQKAMDRRTRRGVRFGSGAEVREMEKNAP